MFPSRSALLRSHVAALALLAAPLSHAATPDDLRSHIVRLQTLTAACAASEKACDSKQVGDDDVIGYNREVGSYDVHWSWLRSALNEAAKAKPADRAKSMQAAQQQLTSQLADLNAPAPSDTFSRAQTAIHQTLTAPEFNTSHPPNEWDRFKSWLGSLIASAFESLGNAADHRPWIITVFEILFFLSAAVGLLFFLRHQLAESRLRIKLNDTTTAATGWARESTAWAELARERAAAQDFREAVHCLYWAAIVLLEGRRSWRHDPSRTPREYVRLLPPGSTQREHLRALTALFERLWYGLRNDVSEADYTAAHEHFLALESNRSNTLSANAQTRDTGPTPEAA